MGSDVDHGRCVVLLGVRCGYPSHQAIEVVAVVHMVTMFVPLLIAQRFINPTQLVVRLKRQPAASRSRHRM